MKKPVTGLRCEPTDVDKNRAEKVLNLKLSWKSDHTDIRVWKPVRYIRNEYEETDEVVIDHATGLMWQKSNRSGNKIEKLNRKQYAGCTDWRLPTLDELCSLLEPEYAYESGLYINPVFDIEVGYRPGYFETSDRHRIYECWLVDFETGSVRLSGTNDFGTLAVRSFQYAVRPLQYYYYKNAENISGKLRSESQTLSEYNPARERMIDFLDKQREEIDNRQREEIANREKTRKKTDSTSGPKAGRKPKPGETLREGRFVAYDNGTVADTEAGLMWAADDNGKDINWHDAKKYCESCRGGYTDWRMPTLDELEGLYGNRVGYVPECYNDSEVWLTDLIRITCCCPWASDTKNGSSAGCFDFNGGSRLWYQQSSSYGTRALPVRSGN